METDETKGTGQDTSSGKLGQSSGSKSGTTSKDKGKLYTVAEIDKIKSDAAAEAGRQRKAAEQERDTFKQDLQSATGRLDTLETEVRESRLAEARGDPTQLQIFQREEAVKQRERVAADKERDMGKREGQLKTDRADVDKDRGVVNIAYTAAKHGLETEELESLGISDPEALERVAAKLAAAKPKGEGEGQGEGEGEGGEGEGEGEEGFTPDSGGTAGGGAGALTPDSVEKMPMPALEKAIEKAEEKSK